MIEASKTKCLGSLLLKIGSILFTFISVRSSGGSAFIQMPNRHTVAFIPGDLVIGILVPVHERPSQRQAQTRTCGAVREQYGIQRVEAAFRTIDFINADTSILPNITLGIEIRDSCWYSPIALEQSIEFIRDAMAASEQSPAAAVAGASHLGVEGSGGSANVSASSVCAPLLLRQQQQQSKKVKNIVGVVGPASSTDTVQVQNLLQLFNMPQVGYSATSRDLSNKNFFKYFLRVVPSDKLQAQVMIDLMLAHNWTYVTVVYTEGSYGSSLMNAFRERSQEVGICFATLESMPPNADDAKFDELIDAIEKHPNARVVICMCEGRTVSKLFGGFKRKSITNEYLVVGSDGWSDRFDVVEDQEEYALGGISIRIHSAYVNDFDDYYFALSPFTNRRNPWFPEFWEARFQCNLDLASSSLSGGSRPAALGGQQRPFIRPPGAKVYNRTCTDKGRESLKNNYNQDSKMAFVQKSIITMALGLDSMQRAICSPNKPGLCSEMLPLNGSTLLLHLMNVSFSFLDEEVYFDEQGDPPGKYEILNFQRRRAGQPEPEPGGRADGSSDYSVARALAAGSQRPAQDSYSTLRVFRPDADTTPPDSGPSLRRLSRAAGRHKSRESANGYEYAHVGSWKSSDGLSLFGEIHWPSRSSPEPGHEGGPPVGESSGGQGALNVLPKSVCSLPCAKGHAKKIQSDSVKCCWVCVACRPNEYLYNEFKCKPCDKGWWPNIEQTGCHQIPIQYLDWRSVEALSAISIAVSGLLLTLATAIVFIRHNNTPVVKSSTRELSYMILFAMMLCYLNTFMLVLKPRKETCFLTRVLPGFAFAMMYGALVTKTNRIARILAGSKKKIITRRPRFMSATSQVAITWIIVLIECLIILFMLLKEPADKMLDYPSDDRVVLVCNTTTIGIIAPLGFDFFLILMCTLYAFKTRNVPENFNEAKFIGFTMYTTLVIWIAFVAVYLSNDHKVTTLCLCISFSALFALFLLFFPKCYIIIFKPEKNNRSYFTTIKNVRCHIGYQIGSAGTSAGGHQLGVTNNNGLNNGQPASSLHSPKQTSTGSSSNNQQQFQAMAQQQDHQFQSQSRGSRPRIYALHRLDQLRAGEPFSEPHQLASGRGNSLSAPLVSSDLTRAKLDSLDDSDRQLARSNSYHKSHKLDSGPNQEAPNHQSRSILDRIISVFARRSSKRESDKAFNIQQHLRAIRHAENLDRQTQFRRSQVQRLVQRFDSMDSDFQLGLTNWPQATRSRRQFSSSGIATLSSLKISPSDLDGEAILVLLNQLLGTHNLWRLSELFRQYNMNQCRMKMTPSSELILAVDWRKQIPLDLDRFSNRRIAIALLRSLAVMVDKSIQDIRLRDGPQPSSMSLDLGLDDEPEILTLSPRAGHHHRVPSVSKSAARQESAKMGLKPSSLSQERTETSSPNNEYNNWLSASDKKTENNTKPACLPPAKTQSSCGGLSSAERRDNYNSNNHRQHDDDPIKRTLDCIMGIWPDGQRTSTALREPRESLCAPLKTRPVLTCELYDDTNLDTDLAALYQGAQFSGERVHYQHPSELRHLFSTDPSTTLSPEASAAGGLGELSSRQVDTKLRSQLSAHLPANITTSMTKHKANNQELENYDKEPRANVCVKGLLPISIALAGSDETTLTKQSADQRREHETGSKYCSSRTSRLGHPNEASGSLMGAQDSRNLLHSDTPQDSPQEPVNSIRGTTLTGPYKQPHCCRLAFKSSSDHKANTHSGQRPDECSNCVSVGSCCCTKFDCCPPVRCQTHRHRLALRRRSRSGIRDQRKSQNSDHSKRPTSLTGNSRNIQQLPERNLNPERVEDEKL